MESFRNWYIKLSIHNQTGVIIPSDRFIITTQARGPNFNSPRFHQTIFGLVTISVRAVITQRRLKELKNQESFNGCVRGRTVTLLIIVYF